MVLRLLNYVLLIALAFHLAACSKSRDEPEPISSYTPILMTRTQIDKSISIHEPRLMIDIGKIYFKDSYIFINERLKGIHIINNKNTKSPIKVGFIIVPGCIDMSMKGSILYADNGTDLIAIDLSDSSNIKVTKRIEDVFPEITPPDNRRIESIYSLKNRPANTIIVGWTKKTSY